MPVHGIAHYNFRLERTLMEEVRQFYEQVVGLRTGPRPSFSTFGYWLYAGSTDVLHLTEQVEGDERRKGSDLTFDHVALEASGWKEQQESLQRYKVPYAEDHVPQTGRRQVFFRDPAGNGVELIFPPGEA